MPVDRTPSGAIRDKIVDNQTIDLSATIMKPHKQGEALTVETRESTAGGAKKKVPQNQQKFPDFSFPPPYHPPTPGTIHRTSESNENHKEWEKMEKLMNTKIEEGLKSGFADILKEIRNLKIASGSDREESRTTRDGGQEPDERTWAPTKSRNQIIPAPPRRLDFGESVPGNHGISSMDHLSSSNSSSTNPPDEYENHRADNRTHPGGPMIVDKWDLTFDGSDKLHVEDFIFRVECLKGYYGCPWTDIVRDFQRLLRDDAKEWYWLTNSTKRFREWRDIKYALLQQYKSYRSAYDYQRELEERRQQPGESIEAYFLAMNKLRARLREPLPEQEMIRILKRNVRHNLAQYLYSMQIYTVEQLRDHCKEVEKNFFSRDTNRIGTQMRSAAQKHYINEVVVDSEETVEEIKIPHTNTDSHSGSSENRRNIIVCWNCRQGGHTFMDCTSMQRTLFCYRCGLAGVISPRCPNCQENRMRGVVRPGEPRHKQNPEEVL